MTSKQKDAIRSMRLQGISYKTIADTLDLAYNTVKSFCYREGLAVNGAKNPDYCKNCGMPLRHIPGAKRKAFCSDTCRYAWWNQLRKYTTAGKVYRIVCQGCGTEFKSYGNKNKKYCGRECYMQSRYGEGLP